LKPEQWESLLVQEEKYQKEKDCEKRHNNSIQFSFKNNSNNNMGIFQEDLLSLLLLCICLIPLTEQLTKLNTGYEEHTIKTKISHLLYTDDLKLIVKQRTNSKDGCKQLEILVMMSM
jgi:hypothetical protein